MLCFDRKKTSCLMQFLRPSLIIRKAYGPTISESQDISWPIWRNLAISRREKPFIDLHLNSKNDDFRNYDLNKDAPIPLKCSRRVFSRPILEAEHPNLVSTSLHEWVLGEFRDATGIQRISARTELLQLPRLKIWTLFMKYTAKNGP